MPAAARSRDPQRARSSRTCAPRRGCVARSVRPGAARRGPPRDCRPHVGSWGRCEPDIRGELPLPGIEADNSVVLRVRRAILILVLWGAATAFGLAFAALTAVGP